MKVPVSVTDREALPVAVSVPSAMVGGQGNFRHTLCVHGELGQGAEVPERQIFAAVSRLCPRGVQPIGKAACRGCLRGGQGEGDGSVVEGQRPVVGVGIEGGVGIGNLQMVSVPS